MRVAALLITQASKKQLKTSHPQLFDVCSKHPIVCIVYKDHSSTTPIQYDKLKTIENAYGIAIASVF